MDEKYKNLFLLHSKQNSYKILVNKTFNSIKEIIRIFNNPSVSVSGGKDSLVMLDLCLKIKKNINVWHWDYGIFMPRFFENEILGILKNYFKIENLFIDVRESQSLESKIGYRAFYLSLSKYAKKNNIDLCFIGLRAEESTRRKMICKKLIESHNATNTFSCYPLREWSYLDIWAYIVSNNIPYSSSYDIRTIFEDYSKSRFVTFFDPEFSTIEKDKFLFFKYN